MRIGYPCINRGIGCTANSTFRIASYSEELLVEKVSSNLDCLQRILEFNAENGLLFFRISSDIVPFASHPINRFDWRGHFRKKFKSIGRFVKKNGMRISMHPDQFVLINSPSEDVVKRSVAELTYHADVLNLMGLDRTAKIQIHVGGIYGDRKKAIERFVERYEILPSGIRKRLVVENDDRLFCLKDCLEVSRKTGIPVLFDSFHHECLNNRESLKEAMRAAMRTWRKTDGPLMVDYSSQQQGARKGTHAQTISLHHFSRFIREARGLEFDLMLEIKDKERSAKKALEIVKRSHSM